MDTYEHKKVAQDEWLNEIIVTAGSIWQKAGRKFLLHLTEKRINRAVMSLQAYLASDGINWKNISGYWLWKRLYFLLCSID